MLEHSSAPAFGLPAGLDHPFLQEFYLRLPHLKRGGCEGLMMLGSEAVLRGLFDNSATEVIATNGGSISNSRDYVQLCSEGYTVGIRHAQHHHQGLEALASQFAERFKAPVDIHLYRTPAGQHGFGWHYDAEEVFVLQTEGSKTWWLKKNTVHPWPLLDAIPQDQRFEREVMGAVRYDLRPGDWLYVPSGYWHRTSAVTDSCSLSIGLHAATAMDIYELLRPHLVKSILWRQRLPLPGADNNLEDLRTRYGSIVEDLSQDLHQLLHSEQFIATLLAHSFPHRKLPHHKQG